MDSIWQYNTYIEKIYSSESRRLLLPVGNYWTSYLLKYIQGQGWYLETARMCKERYFNIPRLQ